MAWVKMPANPLLPVTYINRLAAEAGLDAILVISKQHFSSNALALDFVQQLVARNALQAYGIAAASEEEAELGTSETLRAWSPLRIQQAIAALAPAPDLSQYAPIEGATFTGLTTLESGRTIGGDGFHIGGSGQFSFDANGIVYFGNFGQPNAGTFGFSIPGSALYSFNRTGDFLAAGGIGGGTLIIGTAPDGNLRTTLHGRVQIASTSGDATLQLTSSSTNSASLWITNTSSNRTWLVGVNGSTPGADHSAAGDFVWYDLQGGGSAMVVGATSGTLWIKGLATFPGGVTTSVVNVTSKLTMGANLTAKSFLVYEQGNTIYGFGIQPFELRVFSGGSNSHISFGYISNVDGSTFVEKMRLDHTTGYLTLFSSPARSSAAHEVATASYADGVNFSMREELTGSEPFNAGIPATAASTSFTIQTLFTAVGSTDGSNFQLDASGNSEYFYQDSDSSGELGPSFDTSSGDHTTIAQNLVASINNSFGSYINATSDGDTVYLTTTSVGSGATLGIPALSIYLSGADEQQPSTPEILGTSQVVLRAAVIGKVHYVNRIDFFGVGTNGAPVGEIAVGYWDGGSGFYPCHAPQVSPGSSHLPITDNWTDIGLYPNGFTGYALIARFADGQPSYGGSALSAYVYAKGFTK